MATLLQTYNSLLEKYEHLKQMYLDEKKQKEMFENLFKKSEEHVQALKEELKCTGLYDCQCELRIPDNSTHDEQNENENIETCLFEDVKEPVEEETKDFIEQDVEHVETEQVTEVKETKRRKKKNNEE